MAKKRGRKPGIKTVVSSATPERSPSPTRKTKTKALITTGSSMRIALDLRDVLPVLIVDNIDEIGPKYKTFNIIEDYHSDDDDDDNNNNVVKNNDNAKTHNVVSPLRRNKRVRESSVTKNSDAPTPRKGWAKQALREDTPYSLLHRCDLFEKCPYMMDHKDYLWCHTKGISNTSFAEIITKLERNYAKYLIQYSKVSIGEGSNTDSKDVDQNNDEKNQQEDVKKVDVCGVCARPELTSGVGSFLHCKRCGCQAHVQCWFLQRLPSHVDNWQCPSCIVVRRESSMGRCCICGRRGGVMLPYVSGSDWKRQTSETEVELTRTKSKTTRSSNTIGSSQYCHIICALAFEELTVDSKNRVVHPIKRSKKMDHLGRCVFCHSDSLGARVKCHHHHCYEWMHPACAQLAGSLECYRSAKATDNNNNGPWEGCHFYCRTHFGLDVSTVLGSERISEFAEAHALQQLTLEDCNNNNDNENDSNSDIIEVVEHLSQSREKFTNTMMESVKDYWIKKRSKRLKEATLLVKEVQKGERDFASVIFWPEIMKVTTTEARLARFLCLIPELQYHINTTVEGVLTIPDDEYDDVQEYRKDHQTRTRHTGDTVKLYKKMKVVESHISLFCELAELLHQRAIVRRELVETELQLLEAQYKLDSDINIL